MKSIFDRQASAWSQTFRKCSNKLHKRFVTSSHNSLLPAHTFASYTLLIQRVLLPLRTMKRGWKDSFVGFFEQFSNFFSRKTNSSQNRPVPMPAAGKRWILMDIFLKSCLRTYQKITCEPNISWLEACRSKRPLNSYRPEQSSRRLSSNHFTFA